MPDHEIFKEHDPEDCFYSCRTVHDFMRLTDEMVHTIIGLEEELVRWRQALIKYLPPEWAEGLRSDILNNIARDFEGDPAYDLYVSMVCNGIDPQQEKEKLARMTAPERVPAEEMQYWGNSPCNFEEVNLHF